MPSHPATLIEAAPLPEGWQARARLRCGCEVVLTVPADRIVETLEGLKILVGKYPCPVDHLPKK